MTEAWVNLNFSPLRHSKSKHFEHSRVHVQKKQRAPNPSSGTLDIQCPRHRPTFDYQTNQPDAKACRRKARRKHLIFTFEICRCFLMFLHRAKSSLPQPEVGTPPVLFLRATWPLVASVGFPHHHLASQAITRLGSHQFPLLKKVSNIILQLEKLVSNCMVL